MGYDPDVGRKRDEGQFTMTSTFWTSRMTTTSNILSGPGIVYQRILFPELLA